MFLLSGSSIHFICFETKCLGNLIWHKVNEVTVRGEWTLLYDGLSINIACKMYVIGVNEITWDVVAIVRGIMERNVFNGFFFCINLLGRSQWPRGLRRGSAAAGLLGLWVRIPPEAWMSVLIFVCCQVDVYASRRSLVQRSPAECGVSLCVIMNPRHWGCLGQLGLLRQCKKKTY